MSLSSACSVALISLLAWGSLASGREPPKPQDTSDLPPGVRWLRDLQYVPGGHERQKLDLYLPEKAAGPLPVIVWVLGGGWKDGNKDWRRAVPLLVAGAYPGNLDPDEHRLKAHARPGAGILLAISMIPSGPASYNKVVCPGFQ
jgi:hypothetical protein